MKGEETGVPGEKTLATSFRNVDVCPVPGFAFRIWLTEFSCPQRHSVTEQLNYMKAVLPRLEAASYVYR